ncbi:unnamed protein product [Schistosoma curassoni]|uniref:Uncharacterized protein n=1 Tax=Schistosoma curassoni TaxID=6186 RepID=A0A183JES6_9TREM|nr:unnamed protein product [Schistosoma curassoni]
MIYLIRYTNRNMLDLLLVVIKLILHCMKYQQLH